VALKFLAPGNIGEAALARFRNEVRIARQVSHPNVCRVYDLGMVEGLHFLSMEYIDGEDLASLLRRIGLLPQVVSWVEDGKAPVTLPASKPLPSGTRTRILCQYPLVAKYKGSGSTDDAANFTCAASF
jgi:serine/threonine protein kinase